MFLPAHAATSGTTDDATLVDPCQIEDLGYQPDNSLSIRVSGYVTPPIGTLFVKIVASPATDCGADETIYPSTTGETTTAEDGTFSLEIILDPPNTPYTTYRKVDVVTTVTGAQSSSTCSILVGPCGGGTGSDIVFN